MEETEEKYNNYVFIESVKHGASVGIPIAYEESIRVKFKDYKFSDEMKEMLEEFNPLREVVDIEISKDANIQNEPDDPIILRVYFNINEKEKKSLKVEEWKDKKCKKLGGMKKVKTGHKTWVGYFEIEYMTVGEPPIALGT